MLKGIILIICISLSMSIMAQNAPVISLKITKQSLKNIFKDEKGDTPAQFILSGFNQEASDKLVASSGFQRLQVKEVTGNDLSVEAVLPNKVDDFRELLIKNDISFVIVDSVKIKTSNFITKEKANEIASKIIDVEMGPFQAEYNDRNNPDHYKFNIFYFETKLQYAYREYYKSLLLGYIDKLQEQLTNAKKEAAEFAKCHQE
jgi:hypothetical protein